MGLNTSTEGTAKTAVELAMERVERGAYAVSTEIPDAACDLVPVLDYLVVRKIDAPKESSALVTTYTNPNAPVYARVIAVGPGGTRESPATRPCAVGDTIVLHAGCGVEVRRGGVTWMLILPTNILAVIP